MKPEYFFLGHPVDCISVHSDSSLGNNSSRDGSEHVSSGETRYIQLVYMTFEI
jgi:hypothetical protein